jgi:SPP1 family predicted phage head-tail adaptor
MDKWPSIDPGELRHLVEIQYPVETQDTNGALLLSWSKFAQVKCRIDPYGGGEKWSDAALQTTNLFKFKMRYCDGITTKMRIQYDNRTFDIKNVENVMERNLIHIITCLERLYDEAGIRVQ